LAFDGAHGDAEGCGGFLFAQAVVVPQHDAGAFACGDAQQCLAQIERGGGVGGFEPVGAFAAPQPPGAPLARQPRGVLGGQVGHDAAHVGQRPVGPADLGTISLRYKTGSSRYWCGLKVIGHRNPVVRLEVRAAGGWRRLPRTDYNYFPSADGSGCGGAVRITGIYGQQLVADGITLSPDAVQPTRIQFAQH
jgi:hypothetical protein